MIFAVHFLWFFTGITLKSEELSGSKNVTLKAKLSGGKGEVGWQHAQLFRTSSKPDIQENEFQLKLVIILKRDTFE